MKSSMNCWSSGESPASGGRSYRPWTSVWQFWQMRLLTLRPSPHAGHTEGNTFVCFCCFRKSVIFLPLFLFCGDEKESCDLFLGVEDDLDVERRIFELAGHEDGLVVEDFFCSGADLLPVGTDIGNE